MATRYHPEQYGKLAFEEVQDVILYTIRDRTGRSLCKQILGIYHVLHIVNMTMKQNTLGRKQFMYKGFVTEVAWKE